MTEKRGGGVGDVWHGLMGDEYGKLLVDLVKHCLQNAEATGDRIGDSALLIDGTHAFPVQVILKNKEKQLHFQSIVPRFIPEFENIIFDVEKIDEWANGLEATFEGSMFNERSFSFYCQNYLKYKNTDLQNKKVSANITVVARHGRVLPEKERIIVPPSGPMKGEEFHLNNMRYLNPHNVGDPEICEFFFPIQDIQKIQFWGSNVYKIKGAIMNSEGKEYFYNVFIHPSLIEDVGSLKIGEPFNGWGWIQAEIIDVFPSEGKVNEKIPDKSNGL